MISEDSSLNLGLIEKNAQDFIDITKRLQDALNKIEHDPKLKPTQLTLVKLAKCSRGTINNRIWPLNELKRIKNLRKVNIDSTSKTNQSEIAEASRIERYKDQLFNSREELLIWKVRHDMELKKSVELENLNKILVKRINLLETEINALKKQLTEEKVVYFPTNNSKK